jgi:YegS/Rv2252/BmrU family lipid kinase
MDRRALLIVNPSAGGGRAARVLPSIEAGLGAHGVGFRTELTRDLPHAVALAREAAQNGEIAAALGGDGLVGAVAGALRGTGGVLGVLPGGRGNDLARVLGIDRDPGAAATVLATAPERTLDLGEVDGRTFVGVASCGFDSEANRIANETKFVRGNLVYAYAALRALAGWHHARFTLGIDGETVTLRGWTVAAANSKAYGGGMYVAPGAELDDGLLDVLTWSASSKLQLLSLMPRVFKGTHVEAEEVTVRRAREVTIAADRPFTVYADGDPIGELPVTIRALPAAVRVIAP